MILILHGGVEHSAFETCRAFKEKRRKKHPDKLCKHGGVRYCYQSISQADMYAGVRVGWHCPYQERLD